MKECIIILGFGRSGTTWLSDIITKVTGRLILFEPFHPSVTELSKAYSYGNISGEVESREIIAYLQNVVTKRHRRKWLLRNHINISLDNVSERFLDMVWDECKIAGFKCIRANFMIDWLCRNLSKNIVFIIRHPCATIASIKKRANFWEFGWPETYDLFIGRTLKNPLLKKYGIDIYSESKANTLSTIEKYALMWAITHKAVIHQLREQNIPLFFYEDLYKYPFQTARVILKYLGLTDVNIIPSYLFTPSMTSLRTVHGLYGKEVDIEDKGAMAFWEDVLTDNEVERIMSLISLFGIDYYGYDGFPIKRKEFNG